MRPRAASILSAWLPYLVLVAGCASSHKLAERSQQALAAGDLRKAYEMARRSLEKDPSLPEARTAYGDAATHIAIDYRERIARLAPVDTVAAARAAIEFRDFRAEVARHPVSIATDPEDLDLEALLCEGAARLRYRSAEQSLVAGRPKEAYHRFLESEDFDPEYRDVGRRVPATLELALTPVAILPFENQTSVPDLSSELGERMVREAEKRTGSPALFFTRVIDLETLYSGISVAQMRRMTRDDALAIGFNLHARRVVYGRFTGLMVDNATYDFTVPVFRRRVEKVADGPDQVRWIETQMPVRARERHVRVVMQYEVIDVETGAVLAAREEPRESFARVAWTDYRAEGDCNAYAFMPDDPHDPGRDRGRGSETRWKKAMGDWTLPAFLERSRSEPARTGWSREYRGEFTDDTRRHPVFLGALPGVDDLVFVALHDAEEPVIRTLRELDPKD